MGVKKLKINEVLHIVDVLGSVHRDQIIMKLDKAMDLIQTLDKQTFTDKNTVFFDPFCKAGEVLLATAIILLQEQKYESQKDIKEYLCNSNRFFGLSLDDRHYRMSMRTFYGNNGYEYKVSSLKESLIKKGNIGKGSYLCEQTGKYNDERFKKELQIMLEYIKKTSGNKKIIAIGNPPYQENDGGGQNGKSAKPVYNKCIESMMNLKLIDEILVVIPARWFAGGKGLDKFRSKIIGSKKIKHIKYFENAHDIFPSVDIGGGICFINWNKNYKGTACIQNKNEIKDVNLIKYDIIIPHIKAYTILDKILKKSNKFVSDLVWSRNPFGLSSNYFQKNINFKSKDFIECISRGRTKNNIPISKIAKNAHKRHEYQVVIPKAYGGGKNYRDKILYKEKNIFILKKNQICTETYLITGSFTNLQEAEKYATYLKTDFARFLLGIRKPTHNTSQKTFKYIPLMDTKQLWTNEKLFKYFNLNEDEQKYILQKTKEWTY